MILDLIFTSSKSLPFDPGPTIHPLQMYFFCKIRTFMVTPPKENPIMSALLSHHLEDEVQPPA